MGIKRMFGIGILAVAAATGVIAPTASASSAPHAAEGNWRNPAATRDHDAKVVHLKGASQTVTRCSGSYCTAYTVRVYDLRVWVDCGDVFCDLGTVRAARDRDVFYARYPGADGTYHVFAERIIHDGREELWVQVQVDKRNDGTIELVRNNYLERT